ncbi:MAG: phosphatase [Ruminococcaceae bacterium]|nr:phosphatase [Oscillospiraceae bacterium]
MKIVADLHTHTIASVHAYATALEMITEASELGLYGFAITDHGETMHGYPHPYYFMNLHAIPKVMKGVRVLKGIEANIVDRKGRLDADDSILSNLDICVASLHIPTFKDKVNVNTCTESYLALADNPYVNIIAHSGSPYFKYDFDAVIKRFAECGKVIEINNSSIKHKPDFHPNCKEIAKLCMKHGCRVSVDTDAHFITQLGRAEEALKFLEDLNFPEELVINSSVKNFESYLNELNIPLR